MPAPNLPGRISATAQGCEWSLETRGPNEAMVLAESDAITMPE